MNDKLQRFIEFCVQLLIIIPPLALVMLLVGPASSLHQIPYFSITVLIVFMNLYWFFSWPKKAKVSWFFALVHCFALIAQIAAFLLVALVFRWGLVRWNPGNPIATCSPLVLMCYFAPFYSLSQLSNQARVFAKKIVSRFLKN